MRLFEIHLEVDDLERSLAFYQAIMTHQKLHWWMDRSAVALVLEDGAALGLWKKGKRGRFDGQGGRHVHFAFSVTLMEYDQYKSRLQAAGVELFEHQSENGHRQLYFFDPDGNQGEFNTEEQFA